MLLTGFRDLDLDLDMVTGLWYTNVTNIGSLFWFWGFKEHPCSLTHSLRPWRMLEASDCGLLSWSWFGYGHWSLIYSWSEFLLFILILKVQRTSMSFKAWFGALEDAGGSLLRFRIMSWYGYDHWSLIYPCFEFWLFILILKVQRTSMSFKSWFWSLNDARCSWLGLGILILIWHLVCHYCHLLPLSATFCHFLPLFVTFCHFCHLLQLFDTFATLVAFATFCCFCRVHESSVQILAI